MIVFVGSLALFGASSVIVWRYLMKLRRERRQAMSDWAHDPYVAERNRRAALLFAMWSTTVFLVIEALTYIDQRWIELARTAGLTERVLLLVIAVTLLFNRE